MSAAGRKTFIVMYIAACISMLFTACGKDTSISAEEQLTQYITGMGNRYWHIKDIYINGVKVVLTNNQLQYTKTYTRKPSSDDYSGTFTDSDGMAGTWRLDGTTQIIETITNSQTGSVTLTNTINKLSYSEIDITYTDAVSGDKVRMVYFGY
jgi:hypothetical protein